MSHADHPTGGEASYGRPIRAPKRVTGRFSGLSYEAEPCPECRLSDQLKGAFGGGLVGYGLSFLLGGSSFGRLIGAGLGLAAGAVAAKWHVRVDWDPEALKGLKVPGAGAGPEAK
jgi:hypothetical protein